MKKTCCITGKALLALVFLYMLSCNTRNAVTHNYITPPFKDVNVKPSTGLIDPHKGGEIKTNAGSTVIIPKDAFVYEDGSTVTEPVNINFREFHTSGEILASGIPMTCDSAGKTFAFQTAGMFHISATCKEQTVEIAEGKSITVNLASKETGNYDFYYFNEITGKWEIRATASSLVQKNTPVNTGAKETELSDIKLPAKPCKPAIIDKNKSVLDFDINFKSITAVNFYSNLVWQYTDNKDYPDPEQNKWIFKENWTNYVLKPLTENSDEFILKLYNNSNNKSFTTIVTPVINEKNYKKAMKKYQKKMEEYDNLMLQVEEAKKRRENEAKLFRTFNVSQMGYYNWDCMFRPPDFITINADFKFDKFSDNNPVNFDIFLINNKGRSVIRVPVNMWSSFSFFTSDQNKLIAVLPDNKIAIFGKEDFKKIDIQSIKEKGEYQFVLKVLNKKIDSVENLDNLLLSI